MITRVLGWLLVAGASATLLALLGAPSEAGTGDGFSETWNLTHTCTFCHDPHGGPNPFNLLAEDIEVLCLTCHGPGGVSSLKASIHEGEFTCVDCHDHHKDADNWLGGQNRKLVGWRDPATNLARIQTESGPAYVVFESLGTQAGEPSLHSFADNDEDNNGIFDGVCEVCHIGNEDADFGGYLEDNHNFGQTCTTCHDHANGFEEP